MGKRYQSHWTRGLVDIGSARRIGATVKLIKVIDGKEIVVDHVETDPTRQAVCRRADGSATHTEPSELCMTDRKIKPKSRRAKNKGRYYGRGERHMDQRAIRAMEREK